MKPVEGNPGRTIITLSSREVYRNPWMRVREDEILRSNGTKGIFGVAEKEDAAIILPIDQGRVWLVEQYRYSIQERALELPQGGWEMEVQNPEELARGELKEELGLHAAEMTYLGWLWIAYGFLRQKQMSFWPPA
ncbi:MAG: NUDIX hydrolase [Terracidiphilus sp.]